MIIKSKFKKGDNVIVMSGDHKGSTGVVLKVMPREAKLLIQNVNMCKKRRKSKVGLGDSDSVERPIHSSNVLHIDPKSSVPTKVGRKIVDGKKIRYSRKSGELIDVI